MPGVIAREEAREEGGRRRLGGDIGT